MLELFVDEEILDINIAVIAMNILGGRVGRVGE